MNDHYPVPFDVADLERLLARDPRQAFEDLALLSLDQLLRQAIAYTAYLSASDSVTYDWQTTLGWWEDEIAALERGGSPVLTTPCVYLLHLVEPLSPRHTAQHYIGWTPGPVAQRYAQHLAGCGARFTQVAVQRGIDLLLVRTWPGDRSFEKRLKRRHNGRKLCPICQYQDAVLPLDTAGMIPF